MTFTCDIKRHDYRAGNGWDLHRLVPGRPLVLCGVTVPSEKGCEAHSDGDAAVHAVIDAILGAAGLPDIGTQFPDTCAEYLGMDSMVLLARTLEKVSPQFEIVNVDVTVVLQAPKLSPYKEEMATRLSSVLGISADRVCVKAKTAEHMLGELGTGDAVMAIATATLRERA